MATRITHNKSHYNLVFNESGVKCANFKGNVTANISEFSRPIVSCLVTLAICALFVVKVSFDIFDSN